MKPHELPALLDGELIVVLKNGDYNLDPIAKLLLARLQRIHEVVEAETDAVGRYVRGEPEHPIVGKMRAKGVIS